MVLSLVSESRKDDMIVASSTANRVEGLMSKRNQIIHPNKMAHRLRVEFQKIDAKYFGEIISPRSLQISLFSKSDKKSLYNLFCSTDNVPSYCTYYLYIR